MKVEGYEAPRQVIEDVERIMKLARRRSWRVEYVIDDRTGRQLYYDVTRFRISWPIRCGCGLQSLRAARDFLIAEARRHEWNAGEHVAARWRLAMSTATASRLRRVAAQRRRRENETSWAYVKKLAQRSERIGFDLTLIAELNLNDIKGVEAPSLDACPRRRRWRR